MTTTPEEFGSTRARDTVMASIATQVLLREDDPDEAIKKWKAGVDDLQNCLHPPELEAAQSFFAEFEKVVRANLDRQGKGQG